jgi:hypothetical protein
MKISINNFFAKVPTTFAIYKVEKISSFFLGWGGGAGAPVQPQGEFLRI